MSETYDSSPCDQRTSGEDNPTETLWSSVTGTEEECIITPDEEATHEIKFRSVRRRSFEGKLVANSSNDCIQYTDTGPDSEVSDDGTRVEKPLVLERKRLHHAEQYSIEVCSDHTREDYLKTSVEREEEIDAVDNGSAGMPDGGNRNSFESLVLVPKITIRF